MSLCEQTQQDGFLSVHARYAAHAARALGYAFRSLDEDGYLFEVRGGGRAALFACGAGSPYALNEARAASIARDKAFCAEALRQAGLPVVPGEMFFVTDRWSEMRSPGRELPEARAYARQAAYPLFCKPVAASNGQYAEVVIDFAAFEDYLRRVSREHFAILMQPFIRAPEYRVFVLQGETLFSYRKHPPSVVGDGESTLSVLIAALPRETAAAVARARDAHGHVVRLHDVPERGARLTLESPANRAAGGRSDDLRDGAPAPLARLALAATTALGLGLAGVDIFDVSPRHDLSDLQVIEVNSNPMIKTLEDHGRWDLITTIWRANFDTALR